MKDAGFLNFIPSDESLDRLSGSGSRTPREERSIDPKRHDVCEKIIPRLRDPQQLDLQIHLSAEGRSW